MQLRLREKASHLTNDISEEKRRTDRLNSTSKDRKTKIIEKHRAVAEPINSDFSSEPNCCLCQRAAFSVHDNTPMMAIKADLDVDVNNQNNFQSALSRTQKVSISLMMRFFIAADRLNNKIFAYKLDFKIKKREERKNIIESKFQIESSENETIKSKYVNHQTISSVLICSCSNYTIRLTNMKFERENENKLMIDLSNLNNYLMNKTIH